MSETLYRFIADPGHKETLSGRVRAACVTCRRRKVRCSGQIPCGTCAEKGLVCEGMRERKRPKTERQRRSDAKFAQGERRSSNDSDLEEASVQSRKTSIDATSGNADDNNEQVHRATARPPKLNTHDSNDSGYMSGSQYEKRGSGIPVLRVDTTSSLNHSLDPSAASAVNKATADPPSANDYQDWRFVSRPASTSLRATGTAGLDICLSATAKSATVSTSPMEWPEYTLCLDSLDYGNPNIEATNMLITAAQKLEAQASLLRRLATREGMGQTDMSTMNAEVTSSSTQYLYGLHGEPPLMLGEGPPGSHLQTQPLDVSSWWNINTEQSLSFGYQTSTSHLEPRTMADPGNGGWLQNPVPYDMQPSTAGIGETTNKSKPSSENVVGREQALRSYFAESGNDLSRLYPWPE